MHKKRLHFGDIIFTMPTTYPGLQGIISKAIHLITDGPTHVGLAISQKKVIHLDFPLLKIDTIDGFLKERKIQLVISPKLGFFQKITDQKKDT